ncbi:MAG: T9SS type A sorting domain-containing protein, partial [Ignavibacteriaceae bacterium]
ELSSVGKVNRIKREKNDNPSFKGEKEIIKGENGKEEDEDYSEFEKDKGKKELLKGLVPQREEMIEGENKADHPDLFAKYERDIRTRSGRNAPDYPRNYKIEQMLKTRHMTSTKSLNKMSKVSSLNWIERGPGNVSGRTRGIIVDPDDPSFNTWFVGSVGGGVWKTTNAGDSWTNLTPNITNLATSTIAMAMSNHNVIYAGTGEGFFNADEIDGTGIWKSTDRGVSWNQLASTANNRMMQNITRIIVDPSDENTLLVSATPGFWYNSSTTAPPSGIFRSTDGGTSWDMVYNAGSNSVEDIIANPENFSTQYATINSVGVIKSVDGGKIWSNSSNGIGPVLRMEIAVAPTDTSTLYFSAEGGSSGSILYVSDDAGTNWYPLTDTSGVDKDWLGGQGWYDNCIAVDPYNKNSVYVGGVSIFKLDRIAGSDTSAKQITGVDEDNISSFLSFVNWGGRYAEGGLDLGQVFHGLPTSLNDTDYTTVEVRFGPGMHQKAHRFVFAANFQYPYQDYVDVPFEVWDVDHNRQLMVSFRDQDNSGTWNPMDEASAPGGLSREYVFINAVPYDSTKPDTNIAKTAGMAYKNTYAFWPEAPMGTTFDPNNLPSSLIRINWGTFVTKRLTATPIADVYRQFGGTSKGVHPDQHNITLVKTNETTQSFRLVDGNDGGIAYSDDKGTTFTNPRNGYNTTQFYGVDKMNGADRFIGGTQDNGSWFSPLDPTDTSSWLPAPSGDGFEAVWKYDDPNSMLESSQFNNIFKSTDGGVTWESASSSNGLTDVGNSAPFITKLAKSKNDPDMVFAIGASGIWRSDDFASSWTLTPIDSNISGTATFAQVKMSIANPQIVWAGSGMSSSRNIFVSTDGGLTYKPTNNYTNVTLGNITSLETDPLKDSTAYILFSFAKAPKILKTTDLGQTWTDISGFGTDTVSSTGFPDVACYSLVVFPNDPNVMWAGTDIGIYQTTDGGGSWAYADNGLPATAIYEMVIVNDEIVVATHGRGIWSYKAPELSGYEPPAVTKSPRLSPLAQNPSGMLVIPFTLRSPYDSTHVMINQRFEAKLPANSAVKDTSILYTVMMTKEDSVQVISYKNGITYKSYERIAEDKVLAQPRKSYANDFNFPSNDFAGNGFTIDTLIGFSNGALQSPHPYADNNNYIAQLLVPIIVSSSNATLSYDDIAIVEPGDPGSVYGDDNFWDYVIVEGTKDGINWKPLVDGYDSRADSAWYAAFVSNGSGDSTMFRNHVLDLYKSFSANDTILIRFRLFADANTHGWGWAIDNLVIQGTPVPVELTSFTANTEENKITLSWETATEKNNAGFDIEKSSDKKNFSKIGNIKGRGTTTEKQSYTYTDKISGGGKFYYRLKQIDYNGSFTYSNILEVSALPTVFSLSQNYPNPFNPSTTIKFQLPQKEKVVLEVYNTLGEKVKTLVNDIKDPGFYEARWDGTNDNSINVATGVYIYRIMAGKFVLAKKMIFLK